MITVSVDLNGSLEISAFSQFLLQLEQFRALQTMPLTPIETSTVAAQDTKYVAGEVSLGEPVVADISPDSVERRFREFIHAKGAAAARELLDKYQAPRLKDIAPDKLAAFAAELGA